MTGKNTTAENALVAIIKALCGATTADCVVSLQAVAPAPICGEPKFIALMGHDFPWWLRWADESIDQFRERAAAEAMKRPRLPTEFGHVRVMVELPVVPADAWQRLEQRASPT